VNPRNTGILLLLAAALWAFVTFYELGGEEARRQAEDDAKRIFPGLEAEAVEFIEFTSVDGKSVRLERRDGAFELVRPLEFPTDTFTADSLASGLAGLRAERKLDSPQSPAVYGLDENANVVTFGAGGNRYAIRIGKAAPVGGDTYVSLAGSDDVQLVKTYSVAAFDKKLDDLRRKRIAPFDRDAIDRIEVRWPDSHAVLVRGADGWSLIEPVRGPADAEAVDDLLSELSYLRATGFVDEPPPDAEAGLAVPAFAVRLLGSSAHPKGGEEGNGGDRAEGGEPIEIEIAIGQLYEGDSRLVRAGLPQLFRVPARTLASLPSSVAELRYRTLADFDAPEAERLEIVFQDGESVVINARRDEAGWTSEPEPVASEDLEALVRRLAGLKADDILADSMGPEELRALALDPPRVALRVYGSGGAASPDGGEAGESALLAEVHLGIARSSDGRIVAQAGDRPIVYALEAKIADEVPVSLQAFRSRFVVEPESESAEESDAGLEAGAASVSDSDPSRD